MKRSQDVSVVLGAYLLGVITSLALVRFDKVPDREQALLIVLLAALVLTGLLLSLNMYNRHAEDEQRRGKASRAAGQKQDRVPAIPSGQLDHDRGDRMALADVGINATDLTKSPARVDLGQQGAGVQAAHAGSSEGRAKDLRHRQAPQGDSIEPASEPVYEQPSQEPKLREEDLIQVWQDYWRKGDGHFNSRGLRSQLVDHGLKAEIIAGSELGAGDNVLIVDPKYRSGLVYLLPSFTKSPRAVGDWFDDRGSGALTGKTQRVIELAIGKRTNRGIEIVKRGVVS